MEDKTQAGMPTQKLQKPGSGFDSQKTYKIKIDPSTRLPVSVEPILPVGKEEQKSQTEEEKQPALSEQTGDK